MAGETVPQHMWVHVLEQPLALRQLLDADRCGQAPWAPTNDHHVVFHGLAGAKLGEDFFVCHVLLVGRLIMGQIVCKQGAQPLSGG